MKSSPVQNTGEEHFSLLDAMRGGLAFWVLVGHTSIFAGASIYPFPPAAVAVDLFMLLSGFLMAFIYWERKETEPWEQLRTWKKFYVRRFFRIAPVYYLLLIVAFLSAGYLAQLGAENVAAHPRPWGDVTEIDPAHTTVDIWNILTHVTFVFGLLPPFSSNNALPDWSIGLEMQFYAVFPLLMLLFRKVGYLIPALISTAIYLHAPSWFGLYLTPGSITHFAQPSFLPLKINIFLIGIFLGEARFLLTKANDIRGYHLLLLAGLLTLINQTWCVQAATLFFLVWICCDAQRNGRPAPGLIKWVQDLSKWKICGFVADTSYSVYLSHLMLLTLASAALERWSFYAATLRPVRFFILLFVAGTASYALAIVLHRWVEIPGIRLGKRLLATSR